MKINRLTKLFISHASEDKKAVALPLAKELIKAGYSVWYDEFSLELGDSLRKNIDDGLSKCDYAIIILSKAFFNKHWPEKELDGIASIESSRKENIILPIWHGVNEKDVAIYSPMLAGIKSIRYEVGIKEVVSVIRKSINTRMRGRFQFYFNESGYVGRADLKRVTFNVGSRRMGLTGSFELQKKPGTSWEKLWEDLLPEIKKLDEKDKYKK
ncbi:MAG: toll/interleukin-1 receptor domain-containing protein [bacterium]|jgi:hypothetical protein